jgi:hypothetical protein
MDTITEMTTSMKIRASSTYTIRRDLVWNLYVNGEDDNLADGDCGSAEEDEKEAERSVGATFSMSGVETEMKYNPYDEKYHVVGLQFFSVYFKVGVEIEPKDVNIEKITTDHFTDMLAYVGVGASGDRGAKRARTSEAFSEAASKLFTV